MPSIAIYVRVSKSSQNYDRQITDLQAYAARLNYQVHAVISEKVSGSKGNQERPGIQELLQLARSGTIQKVAVSEISRLGRKTSEVLQVIEELTELGVSVFALNYNLETLNPAGRRNPIAQLLFTFLAEFARLEKETLVERIHSGLQQARKNGTTLGRPAGTTKAAEDLLKQYPAVVRKLREGQSIRNTASICGVSAATVQKVKASLSEVPRK